MAEKDDKKEKKEEAAAKKGGKKKLILLIAAGSILLLVLGGGAYYFFVHKPHQEELRRQQEASKAESLLKPVPEDAKIGPMVEITEFIVNIISENEPHYVKAALSLELDGDPAVAEVNKRMPQIRDAILLLIGNKTFEELQDIQGKNQVKAELKSKINSFLKTGKVNNVYLTDFVVQ
ncbi:MAG: flagellar basal body-associated FliL family protein [Desulfobulbus sp.]|jgi:flagellar FliL protein